MLALPASAVPPPPSPPPGVTQPGPAPVETPPLPPGYGASDLPTLAPGLGPTPSPTPPAARQAFGEVPSTLIAPPVSLSETHAPKYALWVGGRLSFVGFGFSFYENQSTKAETTGNFLDPGVAPEVDVGARLGHRYVPYLFWEHGFMGQGRRFEGTDANSTTDFYGVGFRYTAGNVDAVGFVSDLSIGRRAVTVSRGDDSYAMTGWEFFRLGLGAEIRVTTLFTVSPLLSISSGAFDGTDGNVAFACAPNCPDAINGPTYANGQDIDKGRAYVVLSAGVGLHFDVLGK